ncbi:MAG: DUF4115 domain-containing protein [Gammaproteobacteria bacterium]|nr:DUF4115 domain-containing protein [Gammaproteobacteria bacterium]
MSDSNQQDVVQDETEVESAVSPSVELPGRRLREQRESSHLSQEEVAHHLRLDVQLIKALENDDYSRLPSPAYICGYLRSYARLLKLPEDEIVQAYNHGEQISSVLIPSSVSITPKKSGNGFLLKAVFILIVVVLIVGALYFVADKFDFFSGTATVQKRSQLTVPVPPKATAPPPQDNTAAPAADVTTTPPVAADKGGEQPAPVVPVPESKTVIEELPTPKTTITATTPPAQTGSPAATQAAPVTTTPVPAAMQTGTASGQTGQLQLHLTNDSWVEVTDSTNKRLLYRLVEKDSDLNLEGVPPFTVLLGNAEAVQVFYNGKPFDHKRYRRDEVAYFKIGVQ